MSYIKILYIVALVLCIVPVVSAGNETWFDATCEEQFEDAEGGLKLLLFAIVGIYVVVCAILTLGGWILHKQKWFNSGLEGFGVLILLAVLFALVNGIFEYYSGKYW